MMPLSITPRLIIAAAERRGWTVQIIDEANALYRITLLDGSCYYVRNISSHKSSAINAFISKYKHTLYQLVAELGISIPPTALISDDRAPAYDFLKSHKQLVVKPVDQSHGDGVTVGIVSAQELDTAISYAQTFSDQVLVQRHISGEDYRLLYIDKQLAAAVVRKPAYVVGDGKHTVAQLLEIENQSPNRSHGYNNLLTIIDAQQAARYLGDTMQVKPAMGQEQQVVGTSNIGKGGVARDVTSAVPNEMLEASVQLVKHFNIGLCGLDFMVDDDGHAYLIEINTVPSLGLHENPYEGVAQQTPDKFLDWLIK
jgi:cyanophycin synthetase